jgi:hypothetical protein
MKLLIDVSSVDNLLDNLCAPQSTLPNHIPMGGQNQELRRS